MPLSQIATFDFDQEFPLIWRRDRVPTLTVQADVASRRDAGGGGRDRSAPAIEKLNASLPKGYRIEVGGTVEESAQSQASVFAMVPVMLFLMLLFLMAQLHSFSRLALVAQRRADGPDRHRRGAAASPDGRSASSRSSAFWR